MVALDLLAACIGWTLFFIYRKVVETGTFDWMQLWSDKNYFLGVSFISFAWIVLWVFLGFYENIDRKSRIKVIYKTLGGVLFGALVLLFTVVRDDIALEFTSYVASFGRLTLIFFICFGLVRLWYLTFLKWFYVSGRWSYKAHLLTNDKIPKISLPQFTKLSVHSQLLTEEPMERIDRYLFHGNDEKWINRELPKVIGKSSGQDILVHEDLIALIDFDYRLLPTLNSDYTVVKTPPMSSWERNLKRVIDVVGASLLILITSPLLLWLYLKVKASGLSSVIFKQERLGLSSKPFEILKFRTMTDEAEDLGPQLAQENDERCTPLGAWMRRWRLDELPQFFNVLQGDMSLVGPRPERAFYAEQLLEKNPKYALLWQVKPGITSWGQIKHGYASNITEMLTRFRFDLLYIEQMSILLDFRILFYTIIVLIQGKGR